MRDWREDHEFRGQLALRALQRGIDKAFERGEALVLGPEWEKRAAAAKSEAVPAETTGNRRPTM